MLLFKRILFLSMTLFYPVAMISCLSCLLLVPVTLPYLALAEGTDFGFFRILIFGTLWHLFCFGILCLTEWLKKDLGKNGVKVDSGDLLHYFIVLFLLIAFVFTGIINNWSW